MKHLENITFLGDVFLPRTFDVKINYEAVIFNLEYPITESCVPAAGKVNLKVPKQEGEVYLNDSFGDKVVAVCLANNHIFDFGDEGLADTIKVLDNAGIKYFGIDLNDSAKSPLQVFFEDGGLVVLGFCCPTTHLIVKEQGEYSVPVIDECRILNELQHHQARNKKVIIVLHWGEEEIVVPRVVDVQLARRLIKAGAEMIIGHHAHCIQSHEIYSGKHIFYGLGNCVFPDLNVEAGYSSIDKKFTRRYRKIQNSWNKKSLAVTYNCKTGEVTTDLLGLKENSLYGLKKNINKSHSRIRTWVLNNNSCYFFAKGFSLGRYMISNYMRNPRMIGMHDIKNIFKSFLKK